MIQVDLPAAFTIGQLFAFLSRKYLRREKEFFTSKLLGPFNLYLSTGYATGGLFLLIAWPAWEIMYKVEWVENTFDNPLVTSFYILFFIAMILLGNAGYIMGHYFYRKKLDYFVFISLFIGSLFTIIPFLINWGVWNKIGSWQEITNGSGYAFGSPPFFYGWLGIMSYMLLMGISFGIWFIWKSNKLTNNSN